MIGWYVDNRRSDDGRRPQRRRRPYPVAGAVSRVAGPGRGSVWPGGAAAAGQGVRARPAGRPAPHEVVDETGDLKKGTATVGVVRWGAGEVPAERVLFQRPPPEPDRPVSEHPALR